ncbi:MAG: cytochrome c-type biogenesis protein [Thermoanaerobaculia bacterium]
MTRKNWLLLISLIVAVSLPLLAQSGPTETGAPDAAQLVGPPAGAPLSAAALDQKTHELAGQLRCPVCQGLSVADSPATMAVNMKRQVRELLERGFTDDQILKYFQRAYGDFVLLNPPMKGINWLVWLMPVAILLIGGGVVGLSIRRLRKPSATAAEKESAPAEAELADPDALPDDPDLAPYVLRVRELAYGWPGGVSPARAASNSDSKE